MKEKIIQSVKQSISKQWNQIAFCTIACLVMTAFISSALNESIDNLENDIDASFARSDALILKADLLDNQFETLMNQLNLYYIQAESTNDSYEISIILSHANHTHEKITGILQDREYIIQNLTIEQNHNNELVDQYNIVGYFGVINYFLDPIIMILLPITTLFLGLINGGNNLVLFGKIGILKLYAISMSLYILTMILFLLTGYIIYTSGMMIIMILVTLVTIPPIFWVWKRAKTIQENDGLFLNYNELMKRIDEQTLADPIQKDEKEPDNGTIVKDANSIKTENTKLT